MSSKKLYSGVKSKVAGNRRSIERAKKVATYSNYFRAQEAINEERYQNQYILANSRASAQPVKNQYAKSSSLLEPYLAKSQQNLESSLPQSRMDEIIENIKNKYTNNDLKNMSHSEIQKEVLLEMERQEEEDAEDKFVRENEEPQPRVIEYEQMEEPEPVIQDDSFANHDRSQQLATSHYSQLLDSQKQKKVFQNKASWSSPNMG